MELTAEDIFSYCTHTGSINRHSGQNDDRVQVLSARIMSIRHECIAAAYVQACWAQLFACV